MYVCGKRLSFLLIEDHDFFLESSLLLQLHIWKSRISYFLNENILFGIEIFSKLREKAQEKYLAEIKDHVWVSGWYEILAIVV